ncbi:hypothetical protein Acr_26g0002680 [Actinidia rufa]|uniref:Uncharacterized protein n=1 Tax=Actinidia rufa TaxID=165716 RepID=A0A7J0H1W6_9ERIC|nr:hypothetical protein Acr_26g0002680 [Actinidia rufa]
MISNWINVGATNFAREVREQEAGSSSSSSVQLSGSELRAALAEGEGEGEEEKEEEVERGGNLSATNLDLVSSSDDEAPEIVLLHLVPVPKASRIGAGRNASVRHCRALEEKRVESLQPFNNAEPPSDLDRREEELAIAAREIQRKYEEIVGLRQVAHGPVYQCIYDRGWNKAGDFYVPDAAEDRADVGAAKVEAEKAIGNSLENSPEE